MGRVTVLQWQRAVRFVRGVLLDELGPGEHRLARKQTTQLVDVRPQSLVLTAQDVPSGDQVQVRLSLVVRWRVTDATAFVCATANPQAELHLAAQAALRAAVVGRAHDVLDAERSAIGDEIATALAPRAAELGVEVLEVTLRDVVLPPELRRAALAVLVAEREGQAALARARAETAALRSLLNVARLAEEHPALLQLRTLQAAEGGTVILERPSRP